MEKECILLDKEDITKELHKTQQSINRLRKELQSNSYTYWEEDEVRITLIEKTEREVTLKWVLGMIK